MKRLFALLFLIPALAFGAANDIQISQINAAGTAAVTHAFAPSSGTQFTTLAGWRTAQGLGAGDSPVFTGLTLSGLTAGRVPFVSTAGLLADASTFTFNSVTPALTVGNATFSGTTGSIGLTATGDESVDHADAERDGCYHRQKHGHHWLGWYLAS